MFYYENWQIALLSIEIYRKYGVELFSIPIISVIKELYTILRHYEENGIVSLKRGVVLPKIVSYPNISKGELGEIWIFCEKFA